MKTRVSLSIEDDLADKARALAEAQGENFSVLAERAIRREMQRTSAAAMAQWEKANGMDTAGHAEREYAEYLANTEAAYGAGAA
jgi:post-segregation antitoxin (ccd killing protein)